MDTGRGNRGAPDLPRTGYRPGGLFAIGARLSDGSFPARCNLEEGDFRASLPRFQPENITTNRSLVDVISSIAVRKTCTTAQIALAWLLAQGDDIVPIPGTRRVTHLQDNLGALSIRLEPEDLAELGRALDAVPVAGDRYTAEGMKGVNA